MALDEIKKDNWLRWFGNVQRRIINEPMKNGHLIKVKGTKRVRERNIK